MKKIFMILAAALLTVSMSAADLTGKRIYVNPGHGSYGPNDRPMATIPYPNLPTTGMPDTLGFYESNTNLWKCMYLGEKLEAMGATVLYSRTQCGPWPYEMKNGDYPDYVWCKNCGIADPAAGWQVTDSYDAHPDYEKYNRNLSEICREVEANNIDYFISVHSNANSEGSTANFPLMLYRGPDAYSGANSVDGAEYVQGSYEKAKLANEEKLKIMKAGIDVPSSTNLNIRGDWNFYGSTSTLTINGKTYKGYLGVMKHGASGFLSEGYFHTYQPARHRALNQDYCHMEGLDYYRAIINYYGADKETKGYIVGTVKDQHNKMNHSLFTYAPKTNDQWVPCNGAEVILKKAGVEVARYQVDSFYNGIFVFEGLEPGDDYTLDATCPGYHPLAQDQKVALTVKANETTYPMIYLTDTAYVPPVIVYTNYPNPEQPAYLGVPSVFEMEQAYVDKDMDALFADKTIRRVLYRDGLMYVLAVDADKNPTLAVVNEYGVVEAELPTDFCTVVGAEGLKLSDIAFTAEGVLVGCNKEAVSFTPSNKWNLYKWEKTAEGWTGALWQAHANNETAGNYNNAYVGNTFAYSGTLAEGTIAATTVTTGSSKAVRYAIYSIYDGVVAGALRNQPVGVTELTHGTDMKLVVSPRDSMSFILTSSLVAGNEWQIVNTTKSEPKVMGTLPFVTNTPNYFKYAGKVLMAAPAVDAEGKNIGVAVYDITAGVDKAQLIKTTNTTLEASEVVYTAAFAQVKDADLTLYLVADDAVSKFTTVGVAQPVVPAIVAYDLNVVNNGGVYTFSYNANSDAKAAALVFYKDGIEAGRVVVDVKKGANTYELAADMLPGAEGDTFTWALDLTGEAIANFGIVASEKSLIESSTSRLFNAVNTNPETETFGKIYVMHRAGSSTSANAPKSGIWEFDHNLVKQNAEAYKGGVAKFGNPTRMGMDRDGYLYIADWADGNSGIYVANTADLTQNFNQFFAGTRESDGAFNNNGVYTGSSTPGCYVYHNGNEVKLFVYNEDAKGTLPKNGMAVYNIGQEDGSILRYWETAPSAVYTLTGQANTEGNPWGTSHGFFVSQVREEGQSNASATSLKFYANDGTEQMSAVSEEYKDIITGSNAGGYVVSADESTLVFNGGSQDFLVFDITWEGDKPVLTHKYTINHGIAKIRQMNWDYAGNIVCTGDAGVFVVTLPKEVNNTVVPAKKALTVAKVQGVAVAGMEFSAEEASVEIDATLDLSGLVVFTPADATNKMVTWKSEDETIATVDAAGVVTGVKLGTTKISATSMEGNYSDTLVLTVAPISVKGVKILSGVDGVMTIGTSANYAIAYEIIPANAANKNTTWESSDPETVQVQNTALIIGLKNGSAILTVTTEDGGHTDMLTVVVNDGTSVEDIKATTGLDLNAPMYDVVGRQVDATYKGVIIQNGNKYLLR
ncbi:MAG: Ig-like domain-containing protein [Paludibacteraceae bacterium]|nr:Ig-like domain-containing protein [Paludibacteraceae bacterium]